MSFISAFILRPVRTEITSQANVNDKVKGSQELEHKPTLSPVNGVLHKLDDIVADGSVAHEPLGPRDKLGAVQSTLPRRETECESESDFCSDEVVVEKKVVKAFSEKVEELLGGTVHQPFAHLKATLYLISLYILIASS